MLIFYRMPADFLRIPFILIRIRFVETRLRIRPKIEKIPTFSKTLFVLITQKMIYYSKDIENFNSNENKIVNYYFLCIYGEKKM